MGFYPVALVLQLDATHRSHTSHRITHHTQTKHSTQNYTNSKGHTTHNEYNYNYNKNNYNCNCYIDILREKIHRLAEIGLPLPRTIFKGSKN
jgi:hypothetical protein